MPKRSFLRSPIYRQYRTITYFAIRRVVFFSPAKLTLLGINALAFLAIGTAIAAKSRLFLPQNRLRFSLDDIMRYHLTKDKNGESREINKKKIF